MRQSWKSQAWQSGNIVLNQSSLSQNLTSMDDPLAEALPCSFFWRVGLGGHGLQCGPCLCGLVEGFVWLRGMSVIFGKCTARHFTRGSGWAKERLSRSNCIDILNFRIQSLISPHPRKSSNLSTERPKPPQHCTNPEPLNTLKSRSLEIS